MCGILFHVSQKCSQDPAWWDSLAKTIQARGPDAAKRVEVTVGDRQVRIQSSVLAHRGPSITSQPIYSEDRTLLLLWNGEVFESLSKQDPLSNDGVQIMSELELNLSKKDYSTKSSIEEAFSRVLSKLEGPYAVVLYDSASSTILYGRDPLGRRSLLQGSGVDIDVLLTSAACAEAIQSGINFTEVDCSCLWKVDLGSSSLEAQKVPRFPTRYTSPFRLNELRQDTRTYTPPEEAAKELLSILSESVRKRVCLIREHGSTRHAQIAVLFSGGLDCCTIALLAHQYIDLEQPIDLLNVAFENPRVLQARSKSDISQSTIATYDVPDRKTGRQSFEELRRITPDRQWNFIEVNVDHQEYLAARDTVETLMQPCHSIMDLSISAALYFACRGKGSNGYTSSAKVLLSGLGADELLGGYSRHRKAFARGGKESLVEELQMDLDRLPTRNLGRDDRILSSSGKEVRYPYLSHSVISFLANLPVEVKMDFAQLPPGQGDKKLLREVAQLLGLDQASLLVKRAIQFGARSAKMEVGDGKIMGHETLK